MSYYTVSCPACCFGAMPGPYSLNICPLPHRVLLVVPLISSVGVKIHHSAAFPTPHQLSTSLVSTLSRLDMVSLLSICVCFFCLFVCLLWFLFGFVWCCSFRRFFYPRNSNLFLLILLSWFFFYSGTWIPLLQLVHWHSTHFNYCLDIWDLTCGGLSQELVWHVP